MTETPSGISIDLIEVPLNALFPITLTSEGIIVLKHPTISVFDSVSIIALQSCRESYFLLFFETIIDSKPVHPSKASSPIDKIFDGIYNVFML